MPDFRLRVFHEVRKCLNFSKAADLLCITQPAVSKNISALEAELGVPLFERGKHGVKLTPQGEIYAAYTADILQLYGEAKYKMDTFRDTFEGVLNIGASTTIAQYFLPELLAKFASKNPKIHINLLNGNTQDIESLLLNQDIHLGFIEGISGKPQLKYKEIAKDEMVCIAAPNHPLAGKPGCSIEALLAYPWALREQGSGSLDILTAHLKRHGYTRNDIPTAATLGSSESIKSYIKFSQCIGFLSIFSVRDEVLGGTLKIIDITGFEIHRMFYSVERQGGTGGLAGLFLKFITHNIK